MRVVRLRCRYARLDDVVQAARRVLDPIGFVAVRVVDDLATQRRQELCHRHVALFESEDVDETTSWIRALTRASNRSHVLALIETTTDVWRVREGAEPSSCQREVARAAECMHRGDLSRAEAIL